MTVRLLRGRLRPTAVCAAALLAGCYQYVPVAPAATPNGAEVRVAFTDDGSRLMTGVLGPDVESLDGRVQRADADSVVLLATQTTRRGGLESDWRGERVAVPRGAVAGFGVRRLSRGRTIAAVAVSVAAVVAAAIGFNAGRPDTQNSGIGLPRPQ